MVVVLLLGAFQWVFSTEWRSNEQYAYGVLVPALTAVLVYRRWLTCQPAKAVSNPLPWQVFFLGLQIPLALNLAIFPANPDWRLVLWVHGVLTVASGLVLTSAVLGIRRSLSFAPAWALLLFAVPWPTQIETANTTALMGLVAVIVEQILGFAGIYAERIGNLIILAQGPVGVDEACSGIRSMQLALMVGWFFAEWFRLSAIRRSLLVSGAVLIAIAINVARTLALCLIFGKGGQELMNTWHDVVGNIAMFTTLAAVFAAAWFLTLGRRKAGSSPQRSQQAIPTGSAFATAISFVVIWTIALIAIAAHYSRGETGTGTRVFDRIDSGTRPPTWDSIRIDPLVRAQLRYSRVVAGEWESPTGYTSVLFAFDWDESRISSFAGVHSPATCLPSSGWDPVSGYPIPYQSNRPEFQNFPLKLWKFRSTTTSEVLTVVFGSRDQRSGSGETATISRTPSDRIRAALAGERILSRESFGLYTPGNPSPETLDTLISEILHQP